MTFLGWLSDLLKWLSDLQLGDEKVTKNHLVWMSYLRFCFFNFSPGGSTTPTMDPDRMMAFVAFGAQQRLVRFEELVGKSW